MAFTSRHNKYSSIPDWFSTTSAETVTSTPSTGSTTVTYVSPGASSSAPADYNDIPIDKQTIVWNNELLSVPIDNDTIVLENGLLTAPNNISGVWELRQLTDGTNYIYTSYPVVTQLGITMYADTTDLDVSGIYDGIPIDGDTIYWSADENGNRILRSKGGSENGIVSDFWALSNVPSWITISKPVYNYTEIQGVPDLSQYVTLNTDQTISGEKDFTGSLKVNGSPIVYDSTDKYWKLEGDLLVTGGTTMYSMRSLKNVIDENGLSLEELSKIKPVRYTWKDERDSRLHIGGIADDVIKVLPEVVYKTHDNILTMDYGNAAFAMAASLIKLIVDQAQTIKALQEQVRDLEEEVK